MVGKPVPMYLEELYSESGEVIWGNEEDEILFFTDNIWENKMITMIQKQLIQCTINA